MFPYKLEQKITNRKKNNEYRTLKKNEDLIDFTSNDYLGFAKSEIIFNETHNFLIENKILQNGATGSRLLSGNHKLYTNLELYLSEIYNSESALIFNSGYNANLGFFSSIPQRNDIILYDELVHASIRDGILLSNAKSYKFKHNCCESLNTLLKKLKKTTAEIYVVTESVFSMDGDSPDLIKMNQITKAHNAYFIVDEAHALGVFGLGIVHQLKLEKEIFALIITFGKALGCHGAVILGSNLLKEYLVNFCRAFIYTTGLSPHAIANIYTSFIFLKTNDAPKNLSKNIKYFKQKAKENNLNFIESSSAIQCLIIEGNENTKRAAFFLKNEGFDVKPILHPTIEKGKERLRFCLHSYNKKEEISILLIKLSIFVSKT